MKSLSTVNCQQFLMKMFTEGRIRGNKSKGLSARTVRDIKIALHSCLQKAVDEELISKNRIHLSYLGDKLKVKYDDVNEIFQREYSELMIPNRNPRLYESKKQQ